LWERKSDWPDFDAAYSVQQTTDGGYIVAGTMRYGNGMDVYILKFDKDGNL